jgi:hypothetical protein
MDKRRFNIGALSAVALGAINWFCICANLIVAPNMQTFGVLAAASLIAIVCGGYSLALGD